MASFYPLWAVDLSKPLFLLFAPIILSGCLGMPQGVTPVMDFDVGRYMGTWHEIARLDHSFERGLESVTTKYSPRYDGGVTALNRGYSPEDGEWSDVEGTQSTQLCYRHVYRTVQDTRIRRG